RCNFQQHLREAVQKTVVRDTRLGGQKILQKGIWRQRRQHAVDELRERTFIGRIRIDPTRYHFCLTRGLQHVALNAQAKRVERGVVERTERPCAQKRLVEQILVVSRWRGNAVDRLAQAPIDLPPAAQRETP